MAWRLKADKSLPEQMMTQFPDAYMRQSAATGQQHIRSMNIKLTTESVDKLYGFHIQIMF